MALILKGPVTSVEALRCDKLAFTVAYASKSKQLSVGKWLNELLKYKMGSPYSRHPYRSGIKVYEPDMNNKLRMLVQWDPYHEVIPFVRIDLNPSHADMVAIHATLLNVIETWDDDVTKLGVVTRFDAAVDLLGACPDELLAYYPSKQISVVHCKSGKIETYSLGKKGEDNYVQLYDKQLEVKEKNAKFGLKNKVPVTAVTRIEIRMKPDCNFADLVGVKNPFKKLILKTHYPQTKPTELWRLFIATARFSGLQSALQMLDPATRIKFQKRIQEYPSAWWKPDDVWKAWPKVVSNLCHSLGVELPD